METGEWLTRGTIWLALCLYVASELVIRFGQTPLNPLARWLNTFGCALFLGHVAGAFQFYHRWSHTTAYIETARQTEQLVGWKSGGGIYVNYAFALLWLGEVIWSWANFKNYFHRPAGITHGVRGFFLFMMFNGAFVFVPGPMRWFGLLLCVTPAVFWWRLRKRMIDPPPASKST